MKNLLFCCLLSLMALFTSCENNVETTLLDDAHGTFNVNGVSALDGHEAIEKSLTDMGFVQDGKVNDFDGSEIGLQSYSWVEYRCENIKEDDFSRLTAGLFKDLPSGTNYAGGTVDCSVQLTWLRSGIVTSCSIDLDNYTEIPEQDYLEVNKRLAELFPHSKIGNKASGFLTYYNDAGVSVYYTNGLRLRIDKE